MLTSIMFMTSNGPKVGTLGQRSARDPNTFALGISAHQIRNFPITLSSFSLLSFSSIFSLACHYGANSSKRGVVSGRKIGSVFLILF